MARGAETSTSPGATGPIADTGPQMEPIGEVLVLGDWGTVRAEVVAFGPATGTFTARLLGEIVPFEAHASRPAGWEPVAVGDQSQTIRRLLHHAPWSTR